MKTVVTLLLLLARVPNVDILHKVRDVILGNSLLFFYDKITIVLVFALDKYRWVV